MFDSVCAAESVDQLFLLTDARWHALYGQAFHELLVRNYPDTQCLVLPVGESAKSFCRLETLCQEFVARGATKRSVIIAFGGGSLGNIAGLAAGLLFRGIRFVEVPTSFTHQTDGTLSNKQAINGASGKNQFGLYHPPMLIWTDTK